MPWEEWRAWPALPCWLIIVVLAGLLQTLYLVREFSDFQAKAAVFLAGLDEIADQPNDAQEGQAGNKKDHKQFHEANIAN